MRWDDTNGVNPGKLHRRARGLAYNLERSKTSGPDKATKLLPVYVSSEAWVSDRWLETGLELLARPELSFARDYLVPLPSPNLEGSCGLRAEYADAQGLTRALWSHLTQPGTDEALFLPEAARFWTEHSDRSGCTSWLAALGVPKEQREYLGRWAVSSQADGYARTAQRVVEGLQRLAARAAKRVLNGGPDLFGEEEVLEQLRLFLQTRGVSGEKAAWQLEALTLADATKRIPLNILEKLRSEELHEEGEEDGWNVEGENEDENEDEDEDEDEAATPAPHTPGGERWLADKLQREQLLGPDAEVLEGAAARADSDLASPPTGFVISLGKVRCLHFVGACFRIPGEHYRKYDPWGEILPPEHLVDTRCKNCFPDGVAAAPVQKEDAEIEATSSSSSSSSAASSSTSSSKQKKRRRKGAAGAP
jgi:hypothetical protein